MPVSGILMSRFGGHEINVFNLFYNPAIGKEYTFSSFFNSLHEVSAFLFAALIGCIYNAGLYHYILYVRITSLVE